MKKLFFLSGLPRSGSTILGCILNQNALFHVTPTSPLGDLFFSIDAKLNQFNIQYNFNLEEVSYNIYTSISSNFYNHKKEKYIFDKNRTWPQNVPAIKKFIDNEPKILALHRPIPEIITSYISLIERDEFNFIDRHLSSQNIELNIHNRVEYIWKQCIAPSYESLVNGLTNYPQNIHLVEYNKLVNNPEEEFTKIYNFLNIEYYKHNFNNIESSCDLEKDPEWGIENLHKIRKELKKVSKNPIEVLGMETVRLFSKFNLDSSQEN